MISIDRNTISSHNIEKKHISMSTAKYDPNNMPLNKLTKLKQKKENSNNLIKSEQKYSSSKSLKKTKNLKVKKLT